jgi:hypothetical protein
MNRNRIAALLGRAAVALMTFAAVAACSNEITGEATPQRGDPVAAAATSETPTTTEPTPLDLDDFIATLKVTEKQCFGYGVGCNVTVQPTLEFVHDLEMLENRSYSVTLTISGDESGPVITTVDGTGESYNVMPVFLMTSGSGVTPKAKVTDVQEY